MRLFFSVLTCFAGILTATSARAALITFDLTGTPAAAASMAVNDTTGLYSLTARGLYLNNPGLLPDSWFHVDRDTNGMGIDSSPSGTPDNTDFLEIAGFNERLRLDLGANIFQMVSLAITLPVGTTSEHLMIFTGGNADTYPGGEDFTGMVASGVLLTGALSPSSLYDFGSNSQVGGLKISSVTFETGAPLPSEVPEPATVSMLALGLSGVLIMRRRARRKDAVSGFRRA